MRPGEKLDEELTAPEEEVLTTYHPYINQLIPITAPAEQFASGIEQLRQATDDRDADRGQGAPVLAWRSRRRATEPASPATPRRASERAAVTHGPGPTTGILPAATPPASRIRSRRDPAARTSGPGEPERPTRPSSSVVGQGYVGLPLALRAVEVGFDVVGFDLDAERIKQLAAGELLRGGHHRRTAGRRRWPRAATEPTDDPERLAGFDVAVIDVPTPLRDGVPNLSFVEEAASTAGPPPAARGQRWSSSRPATREPPRSWSARSSRRVRACVAGRDFHLGYSPERIDPGNPTWQLENTPKVVSGIDAASLAAVQRVLRPHRGPDGPGVGHPRGRADQAAREHLPPRQHRPGQRAGHVRRRARASTSGRPSTPPPPSRSATCGSPPGPGWADTACPIDPSYLSWKVRRSLGQPFRFVELANDVNEHMPDYVVRRLLLAFNRLGRDHQGFPDPAPRPGLQAQHRRRPRSARDDHRPVAGRPGRRGPGGRPPPGPGLGALPAGRSHRRGDRRRPTGWSSSPTTTPSTTTWSGCTPATCSTPGTAWTAPTSNGCSLRRSSERRDHRCQTETDATMNVVVTGGAGFIGANLCRALVGAAGDRPRSWPSTTCPPGPAPTWTEWTAWSWSRGRSSMPACSTELVAGADAVVHLAARPVGAPVARATPWPAT